MERLNGSGWTAAASGVIAIAIATYLRSAALTGVGVALVLAAMLALASSRAMSRIELHRTVRPARPKAGATVVVDVRIDNVGARATRRLRLNEWTGIGWTTIELPAVVPLVAHGASYFDLKK